jgi:phage tail sheath protein FI
MDTLHPGLYLQESAPEAPAQGVSTSVGAFVGVTQKGPVGQAVLVTSWKQFVDTFGSYINNSYLAYAVRGFFLNGGTSCYVTRTVHYTTGTKTSAKATYAIGTTPYATVDALSDGTFGNAYSIETKNVVEGTPTKFDFLVYDGSTVVETYKGLSLANFEASVNPYSKYVKITVTNPSGTVAVLAKTSLAGGNDGVTGIASADYIGDPSTHTGLYAFDGQEIDIVAIPGITDVATVAGIVAYAEGRKDCFAILETPLGRTPVTALAFKQTEANLNSMRAALYFSWIKVSDPIGVGSAPTKLVPPSGHIAGIYARTDNARGVFKSPAGLEATILGAVALEYNVTDAEQDTLNPNGVNCLRSFAGQGIVVWGARTTSTDPNYTYTSVRRTLDYIEGTILNDTRWAVFEPNNDVLWGKLTSQIEAFLRQFWVAGGLKGAQESDAFFVQIDASTTTQDDINSGKLNANVGVATQRPAEFIVFQVALR